MQARYDQISLAREDRKILDLTGVPRWEFLVTAGSGFLAGYVLDAASWRGHQCVALARSDAAAYIVADRGAESARCDLGHPAGLGDVFAAARCNVLVNLASLGFGHVPAITAEARAAGIGRGSSSRRRP